ncbi:hypothetical protein FI667_g12089, partial [Globisporangium splendens]
MLRLAKRRLRHVSAQQRWVDLATTVHDFAIVVDKCIRKQRHNVAAGGDVEHDEWLGRGILSTSSVHNSVPPASVMLPRVPQEFFVSLMRRGRTGTRQGKQKDDWTHRTPGPAAARLFSASEISNSLSTTNVILTRSDGFCFVINSIRFHCLSSIIPGRVGMFPLSTRNLTTPRSMLLPHGMSPVTASRMHIANEYTSERQDQSAADQPVRGLRRSIGLFRSTATVRRGRQQTRVRSEGLKSQLTFCSWLARCYIYNNKNPGHVWELHLKVESTSDAYKLLKLIANDYYKVKNYFYAVKAFDVLERLDPDPEYWEAKRDACVAFFQQMAMGEGGVLHVQRSDEVLQLLSASKNALEASKVAAILKKWMTVLFAQPQHKVKTQR